MAIGLQNYPDIEAPNAEYLSGRIKDDNGDGVGTPINQFTNGDIQEFFAKLLNIVGITPNGVPDNEVNGHQYIQALGIFNAWAESTSTSGFSMVDATITTAYRKWKKTGNVVVLNYKVTGSYTVNGSGPTITIPLPFNIISSGGNRINASAVFNVNTALNMGRAYDNILNPAVIIVESRANYVSGNSFEISGQYIYECSF